MENKNNQYFKAGIDPYAIGSKNEKIHPIEIVHIKGEYKLDELMKLRGCKLICTYYSKTPNKKRS